MSDKKQTALSQTTKAFVKLLGRLLAVSIAFFCRILALVLNKLSEILEKISGDGSSR